MFIFGNLKIREVLFGFLVGFVMTSIISENAIAQIGLGSSKKKRVITIGSELDYPPYSFVNADGEPEGFAIDLIRAAAKQSGLEVQHTVGPWRQILDSLANGTIDATPLLAFSFERTKIVEFTDSHIIGYDAVFIRDTDRSRILSADDLKGKTVIVLEGDFIHEFLNEESFQGKIITTNSVQDALTLLNIGQGDAVITSQLPGLVAINRLGLTGRIQLAERGLIQEYSRDYRFGVKKADFELVNLLNEGLKAVRATGEYRKIYDKWFSGLDPEARKRTEKQRNLVFGLLAALVAAGAAVTFVIILRSEVARKTGSLAEAESRLRNLIENIPGVAFQARKNPEWKMTYLADSIKELTGFPAEEFTVKGLKFASLIHPDDTHFALAGITDGISTMGKSETDFRIFYRDGSTRWVNCRATQVTVGDNVIGYDGIFLDVTEQKRVTELVTQQQSKLAASARLSALGEMAGGIAHEINNPLAIINLRAHQLTQMADKGDFNADKIREIVNAIENTSLRISKIIKSLRTVARESADDPFEVVHFKRILDDALELCQQRMSKFGVEFQIDKFPENLSLECRHVQISQVMINLLNNAFDALSESPVKKIKIEVKDRGNAVEIAVADSGPGVSPNTTSRIFQPFFTTKEVGKGVGLGLSISKGSIESHGGELWLDSKGTNGARFVFVLPKRQTSGKHVARA